MLAKEPSHGYQLRTRLQQALGPAGDAMNAGQIYVTLSRLEKASLVTCQQAAGLPDRPDRQGYELARARPGRLSSQADSGGGGEARRPAGHHRRAAPRAAASPKGRAARRDGRAGPLGRRVAAGGHRGTAAGGPALAGGLRSELDQPEGSVMSDTDSTSGLRAPGLGKEYGQGEGLVHPSTGRT